MNKQEKIKQKTWEYFWKQKKEELCGFFKEAFSVIKLFGGCFSIFFVLVYFVTLLVGDFGEASNLTILILRINFLINIIGWPCFGLYKWLSSNWEKARERAIMESKK